MHKKHKKKKNIASTQADNIHVGAFNPLSGSSRGQTLLEFYWTDA